MFVCRLVFAIKDAGYRLGYKSVFDMYRRRFKAHLAKTNGESCKIDVDDDDDDQGLSLSPSPSSAIPELMSAILDWYRKFEIVDNSCKDPDQLAVR